MKYKHHPKQEYPEYDEVTGIAESPEAFKRRIDEQRSEQVQSWPGYRGGKSFRLSVPTGFDPAFEKAFGPISAAIDWCGSRKAAEQERQEEEEIEKAIDQVEVTGGYLGKDRDHTPKVRFGYDPDPTEAQKQQAGFYAISEAIENEADRRIANLSLFERFNSICTPAQYVQLKKEIQEKYWGWNILTPFPKELEGFTKEIIESL